MFEIDSLQIMKEENGVSRGYGFVSVRLSILFCQCPVSNRCDCLQFQSGEDGKRAMDQLNGFELAGRPIKVGHVNEPNSSSRLETDDSDRVGVDLGTAGRLSLMAKLAEGALSEGMSIVFPIENCR